MDCVQGLRAGPSRVDLGVNGKLRSSKLPLVTWVAPGIQCRLLHFVLNPASCKHSRRSCWTWPLLVTSNSWWVWYETHLSPSFLHRHCLRLGTLWAGGHHTRASKLPSWNPRGPRPPASKGSRCWSSCRQGWGSQLVWTAVLVQEATQLLCSTRVGSALGCFSRGTQLLPPLLECGCRWAEDDVEQPLLSLWVRTATWGPNAIPDAFLPTCYHMPAPGSWTTAWPCR